MKFVFADAKGVKQRPALIISTDRDRRGRREPILAAITSNVGRLLPRFETAAPMYACFNRLLAVGIREIGREGAVHAIEEILCMSLRQVQMPRRELGRVRDGRKSG